MPPELSQRDARRAQLAAQGLLGPKLAGGPAAVLSTTRGVQLDTISVLARSHELIAFARSGAVSRQRIERDYWGGPPWRAFEYWYHAACILPIEEWPNLQFKRDEFRLKGFRWHRAENLEASCAEVLAQLRDRGPLTANELGGAKRGGVWWDWSDTKIAVEWLLDLGEVVCTERRSFQRVYDLPERALPDHLVGAVVPRPDAVRTLCERAARALGVATLRDLARYVGVKQVDVKAIIGDANLVPCRVEGWRDAGYAAPGVLEDPAVSSRARARAVMLSPFDSLICDRDRVERLFGFQHRLEAYVPRHKRIHGYYTMPVVAGDRLIGKIDPKRQGSTLIARLSHLEPGERIDSGARSMAQALARAASWVGATSIVLERSEPSALGGAIAAELAAAG